MYHALYDYSSQDAHTLTVRKDDRCTVLDDSNHYWWLVQNGFGDVGYVPRNYLQQDQVAQGEVIKSIDRAIETIHYASSASGGQYSQQQRQNLQKLINHRKRVVEQQRMQRPDSLGQQPKGPAPQPKGPAPGVPQRQASLPSSPRDDKAAEPSRQARESTNSEVSPRNSLQRSSSKTQAPLVPERWVQTRLQSPTTHTRTNCEPSQDAGADDLATYVVVGSALVQEGTSQEQSSPHTEQQRSAAHEPSIDSHSQPTSNSAGAVSIPQGITGDIVEAIRRNTRLSHSLSQVAVHTVLQHLHEQIPSLQPTMEELLHDLENTQAVSGQEVDGRHDAVRLGVILSEMEACKDDSQQRSWALHEDEGVILEYLHELFSILENAEQELSREVLSRDNYRALDTLVLYYQMETRTSIRLVLLQVFAAMCHLATSIITELLNSVLPVELARDIQTNTQEIDRVKYSCIVLTMLLSQGEPVPQQHYGILTEEFVELLLGLVDQPPPEDEEEELPDLLVTLLLAYNLHFLLPQHNLVMAALQSKGTAKAFTEKVMLLANREVDPVQMLPHEPRPPDSVLKLLSDLYSSPDTAGLLYTNDAKVLIDIIARQLCDRSQGDKVRTENLSLVHLVIRNSGYEEHQHRHGDLQAAFTRIAQEEDPEADADQHIVRQIGKEFPAIFTGLH